MVPCLKKFTKFEYKPILLICTLVKNIIFVPIVNIGTVLNLYKQGFVL